MREIICQTNVGTGLKEKISTWGKWEMNETEIIFWKFWDPRRSHSSQVFQEGLLSAHDLASID